MNTIMSKNEKTKRGKGQPTKLNEQLIRKICAFIRAGTTYETAAKANGIARSTLYNWRKRGQKAASGIYKQFHDELNRADAVAEVKFLIALRKQGPEAAKWILQRRWPERWDLRHRRKTSVPDPLPWNSDN